jgi:hypothetical protein
MVADTLKMRKNICLCRHFHILDKKMIAKWVLKVETVSVFVRSVLCPVVFYSLFCWGIKGLLANHLCALQIYFFVSKLTASSYSWVTWIHAYELFEENVKSLLSVVITCILQEWILENLKSKSLEDGLSDFFTGITLNEI